MQITDRPLKKVLRDAESICFYVARPARGHNCLANGSKGPLNGSPLQIKVQMLRDRHLVLREPWLVMGGWFEEAQMSPQGVENTTRTLTL